MTHTTPTEAEMARAVQHGIRSEATKRMLGLFIFFLAVSCAVILVFVLQTLTNSTLIQGIGAVIAFMLPWILFGKHTR